MPYKNKEDFNKWNRDNWHRNKVSHTKRRTNRQDKLDIIKAAKGCKNCSETDFRCLDFHHINPKDKLFTISNAVTKGINWQDIELEISKCEILCCNCHRKLHRTNVNIQLVKFTGNAEEGTCS